MNSNKGQALVEFIIVIPIFILILSAIIDFGNIVYQKYKLENDIDTISEMYEANNQTEISNYINDIGATIHYEKNNKYITIKLEKEVNINTIILNNIIGKKFKISTKKVIGDINE